MGKPTKGSQKISRADFKFEKKLQFYARVKDTVASLTASKQIEKKKKSRRNRGKNLKAYDLSSLLGSLPDLESLRKSRPAERRKLNGKGRLELLLKEQQRMRMLQNDPAFRADPISAIHRRIESTLPPPEVKPKQKIKKNGSQKAKRKKKKPSSGSESMET